MDDDSENLSEASGTGLTLAAAKPVDNPPPATAAAPGVSALHSPVEGNTHTVARGETLTSIAKMYKVTVDDLQKANHIEDGRKLQAGQTITIPTASPAASGSPSP